MPKDRKSEDHQEKPIAKILREIVEGKVKGDELPADIRQECVEHMWQTQGYSVMDIASALNVSERTIKRDKNEIRKRNAQKPSADYALETIGELLQKATSAHEHLMRLSHSKEGSVQEKAQAGYYVWKIIQEQTKLLQSLGYIPEKPQQIEADIHHHQEETSVEELKEELSSLEKIAGAKGNADPEILKLIETAKKQIALAEAKNTVDELKKRVGNEQET